VRENIVCGHEQYRDCSSDELVEILRKHNLGELLPRFEHGLDTKVSSSGDGISLGQKQLIAFMRATLRNPELLILDEATANIDTPRSLLAPTLLPDGTVLLVGRAESTTAQALDAGSLTT
jgi:ATP-binding cassette subfamily B protein